MTLVLNAAAKEVTMCKSTIYDARNNFSALVKIAEGGEPVELTRHDKPVAVIISWEDYKKNSSKGDFFQWLSDFKKENAEILKDFDGLPLPPKEYPDEAYENKIKNIWD